MSVVNPELPPTRRGGTSGPNLEQPLLDERLFCSGCGHSAGVLRWSAFAPLQPVVSDSSQASWGSRATMALDRTIRCLAAATSSLAVCLP